MRLSPSSPVVNGCGLAAYHAQLAAHYKHAQQAALKRGESESYVKGLGELWRMHRTSFLSFNKAVETQLA